MTAEPPFEEIEHTADRAFRIRGRDPGELFRSAARAIFGVMGTRPEAPVTVVRDVEVSGIDSETLLVNWLNELLYLAEVHGEQYSGFDISSISDTHLRARICGSSDAAGRRIIKAVTFHGLQLRQMPDGWEATVVVDV
jgi:SHS2 domain-containing protein